MVTVTWERALWAAALRPQVDGEVSGDAYHLARVHDRLHVGVADGTGHGPKAAAAAQAAMALLRGWGCESPLAILRRCHAALLAGRGMALTLASIDDATGTLAWLGVGTVSATLLRTGGAGGEERLRLHAGIVGRTLPLLREAAVPVWPGDTLVLATDGVDPEFPRPLARHLPPWRAAREILARHRTGRDDALVVVVRCEGGRR